MRSSRPSLIDRIVRDVGVAEDLVQEAFLRVWNRAQGFDAERGAPGPWLLAVARNRAIDYVRSSGGKMARGSLELAHAEQSSVFVNFEAEVLSQDRARLRVTGLLTFRVVGFTRLPYPAVHLSPSQTLRIRAVARGDRTTSSFSPGPYRTFVSRPGRRRPLDALEPAR